MRHAGALSYPGLLKLAKEDLLAEDFEGILQYFRVSLPRKYQDDVSARRTLP